MKKTFFAALAAAFLLASCAKDSSTPPPSLIGKWQPYNYTLRYLRAGRTDSFKVIPRDSFPSCQQDDYWRYNANNTGLAYRGSLCTGETSASDSFSWELSGNVLVLTYANGQKEGMTVSSISTDFYTAFDTLYPTATQPDTATLTQQFKRLP